MNKIGFRKDIAGLRAIAVFIVILFHLGEFVRSGSILNFEYDVIDNIQGGFLGVDVFFVISGFLMTSILCNKCLQDISSYKTICKNIWNFLLARAKRIYPALVFLIIVISIIVFIFCDSISIFRFIKECIYALKFKSNNFYARDDNGYFDPSALENFLLHIWSLSVEFQFYLIYPLILVALRKFIPKIDIKYSVLTLTIIFFLSNFILHLNEKSYYSLYVRAWELLAGGVIYLFPLKNINDKIKKILQYLGISLIIFSALLVSSPEIWSSLTPLFAVLGTILVLWANTSNIFLDHRLSQFLGNISYSLYLYHWPLLVLLTMLGQFSLVLYVLLTFVLASCSYYFIEKKRKGLFIWVIIAICIYVSLNTLYKKFDYGACPLNNKYFNSLCFGFGDNKNGLSLKDLNSDKKSVLIIGDSHARHHTSYLSDKFNLNYHCLDGFLYINDLFVFDINIYKDKKEQIIKDRSLAFDHMKENDVVIISFFPYLYLSILDKCGTERYCSFDVDNKTKEDREKLFLSLFKSNLISLIEKNKKLNFILVGDNLHYKEKVKIKYTGLNILNQFIFGQKDLPRYDESTYKFNAIYKEIADKYDNVYFVDTKDAFCNEYYCKTRTDNGYDIVYDTDHLSLEGSKLVTPLIVKKVEEIYQDTK